MAFLSMESIWFCNEFDLKNSLLGFMKLRYVFLIWEIEELYGKESIFKILGCFLDSVKQLTYCITPYTVGWFVFVGTILFVGRSIYFSSKEKILWIFGIVRQCCFLFCFWEKPCCRCKLSVLSWWLAAQWFVNLSKRNRLNKHKNPSRRRFRDGFFTAIIRWNWKCIGRIITAFVVLCVQKHYRTRRRPAFVPFVRR